MNTEVTVCLPCARQRALSASEAVFERLLQVEEKFNPRNPKSPLFAFNQRGEPIRDPEILGVIEKARQVFSLSDGAFDVTVYAVSELWGVNTDHAQVPQDAILSGALQRVGMQHLLLRDGVLTADQEGIKIDLGGIAKGYALECAASVLRERGFDSAVIDIGGDVYALGKRGKKKFWKIGLRDPKSRGLLGYVEAQDLAVMGSGDYERFFEKDGEKYHHIFDPSTGQPARGARGVTVIYADPVLADAWATAFFVMGAQKGLQTAKRISGLEALIISDEESPIMTPGLESSFEIIEGST